MLPDLFINTSCLLLLVVMEAVLFVGLGFFCKLILIAIVIY